LGEFFEYTGEGQGADFQRAKSLIERAEANETVRAHIRTILDHTVTDHPRIRFGFDPNLTAFGKIYLPHVSMPGKVFDGWISANVEINPTFASMTEEHQFVTFLHEIMEGAFATELALEHKIHDSEIGAMFDTNYTDWITNWRLWNIRDEFEWESEQKAHEVIAYDLLRWWVRVMKFTKPLLESYPDFSQLDRTLFRLSQSLENLGRIEEASVYYSRVVSEYPFSRFAGAAEQRLILLEKPVPPVDPVAAARNESERYSMMCDLECSVCGNNSFASFAYGYVDGKFVHINKYTYVPKVYYLCERCIHDKDVEKSIVEDEL